MRYWFFLVTLIVLPLFAQNRHSNLIALEDQFFWTYVEDGQVAYKLIKEKPRLLKQIVKQLQDFPLEELQTPDEEKAFWINTYNVLVINTVVEYYPIRSPMDVKGFFDRITHNVGGKHLTLDEIENQLLRKHFKDPRLHFALVCAARGCPPLVSSAYHPEQIEEELESRAKEVLNNSFFVEWVPDANRVYLSELFRWYQSDFITDSTNLIDYINQYREKIIPGEADIEFRKYDWALNELEPHGLNFQGEEAPIELGNLQSYTPSTLFTRGQWELKQFNNVYTQTAFFDASGQRQEDTRRATYYTGAFNLLVGINRRLNVGIDLFYKAVRLDDRESSFFSVFQLSSLPQSRSAVTGIAPKVKFVPFGNLPKLAFQTAFVFPAADNLDGSKNQSPFLDYDAFQWWNQLFYDFRFSSSSLLYMEAGFFFRFLTERTDFLTPLKLFFNYYPNNQITLYLPLEVTPTWDNGGGWSSYYSQLGVGFKYLLTPFLELEMLYTIFPIGKNNGAGETYNLGMRIVR
ncbi:MAG: DUF547 domain-containing protein [Calditrichaeota bacterium]|nr:MAG: DUF547 domain-containing protein [Calditrichota bacterium]